MAGRKAKDETGFEWRLGAPKSQADLAYDRIKQAILRGEFGTERRITEVSMASLLGVSRTPVREAFRRLEAEGLLRAGVAGIEIVDPREEASEIHLLREAVEAVACRLAATRATEEEVAEIMRLAKATGRMDPRRLEERAKLNEAFHLAVAAASRAPRVERLIREYRSLFASPDHLGRLTLALTKRLLRDHETIAEAIARRDPDAAEAGMRAHLRAFGPDERAKNEGRPEET